MTKRPKLQTLPPRLQVAPMAVEARGVKPLPRKRANPTGRNADPRRTIPLTSAAWQKLRTRVLAEQPLCRMCDRPANVVDHASGDPSDNSRANLVALCEPCHNHKTKRQRAGLPVIWGGYVDGWPRDPLHPWNVAKKSPEGGPAMTGRPPSNHR